MDGLLDWLVDCFLRVVVAVQFLAEPPGFSHKSCPACCFWYHYRSRESTLWLDMSFLVHASTARTPGNLFPLFSDKTFGNILYLRGVILDRASSSRSSTTPKPSTDSNVRRRGVGRIATEDDATYNGNSTQQLWIHEDGWAFRESGPLKKTFQTALIGQKHWLFSGVFSLVSRKGLTSDFLWNSEGIMCRIGSSMIPSRNKGIILESIRGTSVKTWEIGEVFFLPCLKLPYVCRSGRKKWKLFHGKNLTLSVDWNGHKKPDFYLWAVGKNVDMFRILWRKKRQIKRQSPKKE